MEEFRQYVEYLWLGLASLAGAITSVTFPQHRNLTPRQRATMVFVAWTFAIFVGPLIIGEVFPAEPAASQRAAAFYYLLGTSANWLLPILLERFLGARPPRGEEKAE